MERKLREWSSTATLQRDHKDQGPRATALIIVHRSSCLDCQLHGDMLHPLHASAPIANREHLSHMRRRREETGCLDWSGSSHLGTWLAGAPVGRLSAEPSAPLFNRQQVGDLVQRQLSSRHMLEAADSRQILASRALARNPPTGRRPACCRVDLNAGCAHLSLQHIAAQWPLVSGPQQRGRPFIHPKSN